MPQNGIRMDGIANLARGLPQCPRFEYLDLQDNTFGEDGSTAIAEAFPAWTKLSFLNFFDRVLSNKGEGVSVVIKTIASGSDPKLQTLHKFCLSTLRNLKKLKDTQPFLYPIDIVITNIPHYPEIVTHPMDFSKIEDKLSSSNSTKPDPNPEKSRYRTADQFIADVRLVFSNLNAEQSRSRSKPLSDLHQKAYWTVASPFYEPFGMLCQF